MERRDFLKAAVLGGSTLALGAVWPRLQAGAAGGPGPYGALQAADANGLMLPVGFTSRVVATTGQTVPGSAYSWHTAPDGGATFATGDGGWIYTSNSEVASGAGGAGMLRFDAAGNVVGAGRILGGTSSNCAGGPTPWGSWLSCEEHATGRVWECDPAGVNVAVARPAMGAFPHEAATVDPVRRHVYLTEDQPDGGFYRFVPTAYPDLASGTLQVMTESGGALGWATVPDPDGTPTPCRDQVATMKVFNGGEGCWYDSGKVYFTTKGDNRVWTYDPVANALTVIYDDNTSPTPVLTGVDNVTVSRSGDVFVAEDGGNMEVCILSSEGDHAAFLRLTGVSGSEITGPAFSPDGTRFYFSSQRSPGRTYEVQGPFRTSAGGGTTTTTSTSSTSTSTTAPPAIVLTATKRTSGRKHFVDLRWSGAAGSQVRILRNDSLLTTTANDGAHTDNLNRATGTFRYRVTHTSGTPQSNEVTVTF